MRASWSARRIAWACFGAASLCAIALIGLEARDTTFTGDEWAYLHRLAHQSFLSALFEQPPGAYLIPVPMLVYAALVNVFGIDSYLPFRIAGLLALVLASGLLFELTRRRIGYLAALPAPILLLFFGAGGEMVVIPTRLPGMIAICAGLGMLLALDRNDLRGDVVACLLGVVAVLSHPVSLAFVAAAGVRAMIAGARLSLVRSWIALFPAGIFGLWTVTLRQQREGAADVTPSDIVGFVGELFVAIVAALTGIFRPPWTSGVDFINPVAVAIAITLVIVAVVALVGARRVSVGLVAASAALTIGLVSPALSHAWLIPDSPRYIYAGAILMALVATELVAATRPRPRRRWVAVALVGVVFVSALYSNVALLRERASDHANRSTALRAELGALELARPDDGPLSARAPAPDDPGALIFFSALGQPEAIRAGAAVYYEITDAYGSPAFGADVLPTLSASVRDRVDRVLATMADVSLRAAPPVTPISRAAAASRRRGMDGTCVEARAGRPLDARPDESVWIELDGRPPPEIRIGRFADGPVVSLEWPPGANAATLSLPPTGLPKFDWRIDVATGQARMCVSRQA